MARNITKTQRVLAVYHLLRYCSEVSMKELEDNLPGCRKTFSRDIALLKKAGIPVRYSARQRAFILDYEKGYTEPNYPEGKSERRYLEKLVRLIEVMQGIPYEDCDIWYTETFPGVSKRTMQRDFATLNSIGYDIRYARSEEYVDFDMPVNRYYCDEPNGAYGLEIS